MENSEYNPTTNNNNLGDLRADIAATTDALKITVNKLVQRGENLDALNNRAEDLNSSSIHFRGAARRVRRQMWWQNCKLTFFIILAIVCIITFLVLIILHPWKK